MYVPGHHNASTWCTACLTNLRSKLARNAGSCPSGCCEFATSEAGNDGAADCCCTVALAAVHCRLNGRGPCDHCESSFGRISASTTRTLLEARQTESVLPSAHLCSDLVSQLDWETFTSNACLCGRQLPLTWGMCGIAPAGRCDCSLSRCSARVHGRASLLHLQSMLAGML
jgi:hypothetical protein